MKTIAIFFALLLVGCSQRGSQSSMEEHNRRCVENGGTIVYVAHLDFQTFSAYCVFEKLPDDKTGEHE